MNDVSPIKKGRKFDQVLEGARAVFMADGYEGSSVDAIAKAAGVSKATLYSYFADKRLLFMEVAKAECCLQIEEADAILCDECDPRRVLCVAAERMLEFFLSDFGQSIFRMCVAESDRFPELGREFYETGPKLFRQRMVDYMRDAVEDGHLVIDDLELAADQFAELCKSHLFSELMFGIRKTTTEAERQRVIDGAVDTFLARYGAKQA
ncbi:MAG: TetR/AcrR family transcriptional regulator [Jannaschia helgolandensis]|jgi:AcrR family transcriptional regulator|uniref:Transcriptional regulator, TetR family n=1 Tax=Jannaschia helgolandensis TaxID=188906 RepID=A0A1H7GAQ8_9RHOB|nr:TetR/AcrR family transcriptional regulator [Jannaschia helgolandensis]SEK35229.1 transcriptional regulator, TetR family [Jannaschia helgolandensis]|tara:strand:- start:2382 stop:3005 length:624 start_codon:yes stop_codon:yes gene_type:complete